MLTDKGFEMKREKLERTLLKLTRLMKKTDNKHLNNIKSLQTIYQEWAKEYGEYHHVFGDLEDSASNEQIEKIKADL